VILVVVDTSDLERIAEALRAAVGLGLRGDTVHLALTPDSSHRASSTPDPRISRALATLPQLGQTVSRPDQQELRTLCHSADKVEVWT